MKITYTDFLAITDSIRNRLYEHSFPALERDIIMNALGLYGARIPGKLENGSGAVGLTQISSEPTRCKSIDNGRQCALDVNHGGVHECRLNGKRLMW